MQELTPDSTIEQTDKLLHGQSVNYSGWLHSSEYRRNALADNVTAQVIMKLVPAHQPDTYCTKV